MNNKFSYNSITLLPVSTDVKYTIKLISKKSPILYTGFNICIFGKNDNAFLQRLTYTSINNDVLLEFYGPNIEEGIKGILIAPENDKWNLKNIELSTNNETLLFNCNMNIGSSFDTMASYMEPIIKSEIDMTDIYLNEYINIKNNILINTIEFTLIGALITAFFSDIEKAYSFALGGGIGLLYIKLLEIGIDNLGNNSIILTDPNNDKLDIYTKFTLFNNSTVRLGTIFALSAAIVTKYKENILNDHKFLIFGLLGFTMYKIGLIVTYNKKDMRK